MMNLTLPKWLQPKDSVSEQPQQNHDDPIKNKIVEQILSDKQQISPENQSLTYLDNYIHQWF